METSPYSDVSTCSKVDQIKNIRIFNGCEVLIENSVTRVTVTRMTEFSICTEEPLWTLFLAYSSFDNCIYTWICVVIPLGINRFRLSVRPFVSSFVRLFVLSFVRSYFRLVRGITQRFTLKQLGWSISHQPLIRKHSYLDHRYPRGSAFIPWLLTPESMPPGWG